VFLNQSAGFTQRPQQSQDNLVLFFGAFPGKGKIVINHVERLESSPKKPAAVVESRQGICDPIQGCWRLEVTSLQGAAVFYIPGQRHTTVGIDPAECWCQTEIGRNLCIVGLMATLKIVFGAFSRHSEYIKLAIDVESEARVG
jgi:hypothetical protein